ncbi:MAG TPA: prepilin-type N-terminal cleavage/methylation domain-containing protein [Armatimonadota bacterium]|jgi:prepilin-type N-terminal cleavage/methylation domain-containing protein/prepilin-type processing-associated H-X9-DG protein
MARKGFTLIELLVVIAIIAILAAILFPVFARARMKAQQSTCLSNIKQIALANAMYMSDNDQKVFYFNGNWIQANPPMTNLNGNWETYFCYDMMPYIKNQQVFACPTSTRGWPDGNDYGINMCALSGGPRDPVGGVRGGNNPVKDSEMNCAATILCFDGNSGGRNWVTPQYASRNGDAGPNCSDIRASDRHNEGANVAFYDGHAKWMKLAAMFSDNRGVTLPGGTCNDTTLDMARRAPAANSVNPNPWWTGSNES